MVRHPLTLLTNEVPAIRLERQRSCLILQDLHRPLADAEHGWLIRKARNKVLIREFDEYFDSLQLVSDNFRMLANTCRNAGIDVVYVSLAMAADSPPSAFQKATGWTWEAGGAHQDFPEAWRPAESDRVFTKRGWGALSSPQCSAYLADRDIQSVIVAGTMYDYGIRHSCYELADIGIASLVASDAVVALTASGHSHISGNLAHGLTKLRSTTEIVDLLQVMGDEGHVLV